MSSTSTHKIQQSDKTHNQSSSSEVSLRKGLSEVRISETALFNKDRLGLSKPEMNENENLRKLSELEENKNNVEKMISAFETGVAQDKKLQKIENQIGSCTVEEDKKNAETRLQRYWNLKKSKERTNGSEDMQRSVYTNKAQECNKQRRKRSSVSERRDEKEVSLKNPNRTPTVSSNKLNLVRLSARGSGLWIFPDGTKDSCLTSAEARYTNPAEGAAYRRKVDYFVGENIGENHFRRGYGDGATTENYRSITTGPKEQKFETSADSKKSGGPVGQIMKAVIMVGFASLVLLTRQRNQR